MREIIYNITQRSTGRRVALANLTEEFTKDNLLGIINKTQGEVLYTPLQVGNIQNFQYQEGSMLITLSANVPSINAGDELLVKLYSDKEIDLSAFAKESTLLAESQVIQSAIQNIDLSSVESKVDEVKQAVENIDLTPIENKVQEGVNFLSVLIDNIDLSKVENKVQEESTAIQNKIDNIKLPEIDTSELAKQGENPEATNSKILEEVQNKLTPLEAVLTELNNGKQKMVDALATKNVQSSTTKTLSSIASDIRSIAQSPITIDGGEMYEKQLFGAATDKTNAYEQPDAPMWNLYQVMANILSDGRFTRYGGIVLCEYDKSVNSQLFEGASIGGIYFTSEGKIVDSLVEYVWNDFDNGKSNRWVAIINKEEYINVTFNTVENTPLSIHIGRKVGLLTTTQARTNIREIICTEGNEYTLKLAQTTFGEQISFEGIGDVTNLLVPEKALANTRMIKLGVRDVNSENYLLKFNVDAPPISVIFSKIGKVTGKLFLLHYGSATRTSLSYIQFPNGYVFEGDCIIFQLSIGKLGENTTTIKGLKEITKGSIIYNQHTYTNVGMEYFNIPDLEIMGASALIIKAYNNGQGCTYSALKRISIPKLRQANVLFSVPLANDTLGVNNLIDVEVGAMETSFSVGYWRPLNILADADKTAQLNTNIRDHIAAKVTDRNGQEPLTITFHQLLRNALTEETEQAFTAKNWNIAPAKSV